jgi:hypothetical protein
MADALPQELVNRCAAIQDPEVQGEPLTSGDYVWLVVVTILVPAILIVIGALL